MPAATIAADPPLDPPGTYFIFFGFLQDPKIECSSTNIDEQMFFCDRKGKEEVNYFIRAIWHPLILSPFRTELHEANMIEQSCLQSTGVMFDNGAQMWGYND